MRMGWTLNGWVVLSALALGASCAGGRERTEGGTGGGGGLGGADATGAGGAGQPGTPATCGAPCETDLAAARAALERADYAGALELYRCANNPEAAFGAGLTRLLSALEGGNADALLADLGLPHLPANQLLGPSSYAARENARWQGGGALTLTGGIARELNFDRGQQEISGPTRTFDLMQADTQNAAYFALELQDGAAPITTGTVLALTFDCSVAYASRRFDERVVWVDLGFEVEGDYVDCSVAYSPAPGVCDPDGGRIVVSDAGVPGAQAVLSLDNLLFECWPDSGAGFMARVNGTVDALTVNSPLDTTGLHPIFQPEYDFASGVPAATDVTAVIQHAALVTAELEEAACFFRRAGEGTGTVFTAPGELYAGADVAFSQGDSQVVAAGLLFLAAAGQLAAAYELPMLLKDLLCEEGACPTDGQLVASFNSTFAQVFHPARLAAARRLLTESAMLLDEGMGHLDAQSLLVRNTKSAQGLDRIRDVVQATRRSLEGTNTPLPHVSPAVSMNLGAFFDQPRNPHQAQNPILLYQEQCDPWGCWSETELNTAFVSEHFAGVTDADWENGDYAWENEDITSDGLAEALGHALGKFLVGTR